MRGLKKVVEEGLKSVAGWQGWVGKELGSWIGYDTVDVSCYSLILRSIEEESC